LGLLVLVNLLSKLAADCLEPLDLAFGFNRPGGERVEGAHIIETLLKERDLDIQGGNLPEGFTGWQKALDWMVARSKAMALAQRSVLREELQLAATMGFGEFFQEAPPEQARQHPHPLKNSAFARRTPTLLVKMCG